jgi:hypothetical protein
MHQPLVFEVRGVKGTWGVSFPPPEVGAKLMIPPFGEVKVEKYQCNERGELRAIVRASDPAQQEILDVQEGIGGEDIDYTGMDPIRVWKLRVFHTPKGSNYGPDGAPVPERCPAERGGYGNFSVDSQICVPGCPHMISCHSQQTGLDPNTVIEAPRRRAKGEKRKSKADAPKTPKTSRGFMNPYSKDSSDQYGKVAYAVLEEIFTIAKLNPDKNVHEIRKGHLDQKMLDLGLGNPELRNQIWKIMASFIDIEPNTGNKTIDEVCASKKKCREKNVKELWGCSYWHRLIPNNPDPGIWFIRPAKILDVLSGK